MTAWGHWVQESARDPTIKFCAHPFIRQNFMQDSMPRHLADAPL
jgi:hypothetical protein